MTLEDQQIAIAKACNICVHEDCRSVYDGAESGYYRLCNACNRPPEKHPLPDYLNDLNAMHEAEGIILDPNSPLVWVNYGERGEIKRAYQDNLERAATLGGTSAICATAAQRAEAFLKTLGLWIP